MKKLNFKKLTKIQINLIRIQIYQKLLNKLLKIKTQKDSRIPKLNYGHFQHLIIQKHKKERNLNEITKTRYHKSILIQKFVRDTNSLSCGETGRELIQVPSMLGLLKQIQSLGHQLKQIMMAKMIALLLNRELNLGQVSENIKHFLNNKIFFIIKNLNLKMIFQLNKNK